MNKIVSIQSLIAIIEEGSFAAAARKLGLSRAAVNKHIVNIEEHLDTQLLTRTTRKVTPTQAGLSYYETSKRVLEELLHTEQQIQQQQNEPTGRIKINAPMSFGNLKLGPALALFMQKYPKIYIECQLNDRRVDPYEEGYDLTLRIGKIDETVNLVAKELCQIELFLAASTQYLNKHGTPESPEDLAQHNLLQYGHGVKSSELIVYKNNHERFKIQTHGNLCANNGEILTQAAIEHLGIVYQPNFILEQALKDRKLVRILEDYHTNPVYLHSIYPYNRRLSSKVTLLVNFLMDYFDNQ